MEELIYYFNGNYMKESEVKIPILDNTLWRGTAVFDQARTYNHVPFFFEEHIDRLYRSLRYVHIDIGLEPQEMLRLSLEVLERNKKYLEPLDDFMISQWVGLGGPFYGAVTQPNVLIACQYMGPTRYEGYVKAYQGVHLVVANTRQIPPQCLDVKIKHTSRWSNRLADFEAKMVDPGAWALMLDIYSRVAEGPAYNCFMIKNGKLFTPMLDNILGGVTRGVVLKLAKEVGIEIAETNLYVYDLYNADEIFATGAGITIAPVSKFNERELAKPIPGPITQQLISTFNKLVGIDFVQRVLDYFQAKAKITA